MKALAQCGGQATLFTYKDRDRDFKPVLRQALADAPDVLFLPNPTSEVVLQGLAARQLGFTGILLGGDSWNGPQISGLAAFDGAIFVDHWREDAPGKRSEAYAAAFRKEFNRPATEVGAMTQDAVDVVLAAVARAGSVDPEAVTKQLMALPPFSGVTGRFDFENDGNPVKSLYITRVIDQGTHIRTIEMPPPEPCR
jgi:branched-chain amino acid transport system substrate-binding protein